MKGKLVLIATGAQTDTISYSGQERETWITSKHPFNIACTVVPEAHFYADSHNSQSRLNKLFTYAVLQALKEGNDIVLLTEEASMIDKRLREQAIVLSLPTSKSNLEERIDKVLDKGGTNVTK